MFIGRFYDNYNDWNSKYLFSVDLAYAQVLYNNNNTSKTYVQSTVSVSGNASARVQPDKLLLTLGVDITNKTLKSALELNSAITNKVFDALATTRGVDNNDIKRVFFDILPNYNYSGSVRNISGYTVSNSIQIETNKIGNLSLW